MGASAVPALLPLYARHELGGGATVYGVLLGFFGAGGVIGGLLMPQVRRHLSRDQTLTASGVIYAAATAILGEVNVARVAYAAMCVGGLAWVLGMTSLKCHRPSWINLQRTLFSSTDFHLAELFAQHGADLGPHLLRDAGTLQIIAERIVDEGLIITAMCFSNQFAEVIDDVAVQPNRDANLLQWQRNDRPALSLTENIFALHIRVSSYCARSREVALRAEIIRVVLPRSV